MNAKQLSDMYSNCVFGWLVDCVPVNVSVWTSDGLDWKMQEAAEKMFSQVDIPGVINSKL